MEHVTLDLTSRLEPGAAAFALARAVAHGPAARRTASRSANTTPVRDRSHKMAEAFAFDSPGEADAMTLADVLEDVVAFRPQPVEIRFDDRGRLRKAFPDLGLHMVDGTLELWEVKPERADQELIARLRGLRAALRMQGIAYHVRTRFWLNREPHLANATELRRHATRPLPGGLAAAIRYMLRERGATVLGALRAALGLRHADCLAAVAQGVVAADIGAGLLGDLTPVRAVRTGARSGAYVGYPASAG